MKVILYTTSDCMFSKQEKDYLASKNIPFEEKNVQTNRDFLQEMLNVSNNFAGTPVTKIDKDDGQSVVLKGFTQSEFDNVFASNVQAANSTMPVPPTQTDQPAQDQPVSTPPPDPVVPDVPEPTPTVETPPVEIPPFESPAVPPTPVEAPSNPDPLPTQDDSTTEMHSTIPINPTTTNDPVTPPTTTDQPASDPVVPDPTPMTPVETPPTVETPVVETPSQPDPAVNQDQQLNAILDSLKTKAEAISTPAA